MEKCLPESVVFVTLVNMIKVIFPLCTLTWRVNNYVSRQIRGIYRRIESTIFILIIVYHCKSLIEKFLFNSNDCR